MTSLRAILVPLYMNNLLLVQLDVHRIGLGGKITRDLLQIGAKIICFGMQFQGKIKVFRVTGNIVEKTSICAAVKGQRLHSAGTLQTLQNTRLQIFTNKMDRYKPGLGRRDECS